MEPPGDAKDISPFSAAAEDLDQLRGLLRESVRAYSAKLEAEIVRVREALGEEARKRKPTSPHFKDARDIGTLVRNLDVKPEKGRRRDLKKIESLVEDIAQLIAHW
jgi:hypothetical protein